MADSYKLAKAQEVYNILIDELDRRKWKYERDDIALIIHFGLSGDDIPMKMIFVVDIERQLISLLSPLPFNMSEDKLIDGAIATCMASEKILDGSFDYDITDRAITYRMTQPFMDCKITSGVFEYMIGMADVNIDKYNDGLLMLNKGLITLESFIEKYCS